MRHTTILIALSASRLILAPFVAVTIVTGRYWIALILFVVAGITDALDGYLARHLQATSRLGADLDSIGDKVLVGVTYLSLGWTGDVPWWLVVLVFSRDLLILTAAVALRRFVGVKDFEHSLAGKLATQIHAVTLGMVLLHGAIPGPNLRVAVSVLIWLACAGTLWSGIDYAIRGALLAKARRD